MSERFNKTRESMRTYLKAREADGFRRITVFVHDEDRGNLRKISEAMLEARGWKDRK